MDKQGVSNFFVKSGVSALKPAAFFCLTILFLFTFQITQTKAASLSQADIRIYEQAFEAADKKRWDRAFRLAKAAKDPILVDVLYWSYYGSHKTKGSFEQITQFIEDHTDWPNLSSLHKSAEADIHASTPPDVLKAWFSDHEPYTVKGLIHYARVLTKSGEEEKAKSLIRKAWHTRNMPKVDELAIRRSYRKWLSNEDNEIRLDNLVWNGHRYGAQRQMRRVKQPIAALAHARVALRRRVGGVDWAIRQVPDNLKNDPGLVYERLRWRVRKRRYEDAIPLLNNPEQEAEYASLWWKERGLVSRWLLKEGRHQEAYDIASQHAAIEGYAYADAEWLSGWIALRYLNNHQAALNHFENMEAAVKFPVSLSRAAYWTGRSLEAMGKTADAEQAYARAANFSHRFYGQLALAKLPASSQPQPQFKAVATEFPAPVDRPAKWLNSKLPETIEALSQAKQDDLIKSFFNHIARQSETTEEFIYISHLARQLGRNDMAVKIARIADRNHVLLPEKGYPVYPIDEPDYLETAIIQSIIRQESGFDHRAKSSAGALGMMQLLPGTAKIQARAERIKYSKAKLTSDPAYNIRLGQAYLGDLIEKFDGSLPMAFAGYNAGPGRVKRWVTQNGDPRVSLEEMIDWIEHIPFNETRNYVQRVSEHLMIYRQKLGLPQDQLTLKALTYHVEPALSN